MIERPERQIEEFARAGADLVTVHAEATPHLNYVLAQIRAAGMAAGLAVCPSTPLEVYGELTGALDLALCMTVNPGWGGQTFIESSIGEIARLRALLGDGVAIEVDGGIEVGHRPALPAGGRRCLRRRQRRVRLAGSGRRLRRARRSRRRSAPVERGERQRQQPGGAGVADLGAHHLVGHDSRQHPGDEDRRRRSQAPPLGPPVRGPAPPG